MDRSGKTTYSSSISIRNNETSSGFSLYPKPNHGSFVINVGEWTEHTKIEIVDLNGATRVQMTEFPENGNLEIKDLDKGLFFVRLHQEGAIKTQKVFIY